MSVNNGQALLVVNEYGDWLSVIPIVVPVEVALQILSDLWDRFSRDLGNYALLGKRTAEGETLAEYDPRNDAKIFDSVVSTARAGPITGGKGTAEQMWALRRQGDMLYLVSGRERAVARGGVSRQRLRPIVFASLKRSSTPEDAWLVFLSRRHDFPWDGRAERGILGSQHPVGRRSYCAMLAGLAATREQTSANKTDDRSVILGMEIFYCSPWVVQPAI